MQRFSVSLEILARFRHLGFWIFLASGPTVYFLDQFFDWLNETYWYETVFFVVCYFFVLIVFFLDRWLNRKQFHLVTFSAVVFFTLALETNLPHFVYILGFRWYIHPAASYVKNHCHPIQFQQDKKTYLLGLCDLKIDETGQSNFIFLYDTSGDAAQDNDFQGQSGRRDRKEWVAAIRRIFNDDPNEIFEIADFYTIHIYGDFYWAAFDEASTEGFTKEYGPPPYNPRNLYENMF